MAMTIASAFNDIAVAQGGAASKTGSIAGAIDALNDTLAGSDQPGAATIEDAVRLLGAHIGGGPTPSGTIEITENGTGIDVASYAYADVSVSGGLPDDIFIVRETGEETLDTKAGEIYEAFNTPDVTVLYLQPGEHSGDPLKPGLISTCTYDEYGYEFVAVFVDYSTTPMSAGGWTYVADTSEDYPYQD